MFYRTTLNVEIPCLTAGRNVELIRLESHCIQCLLNRLRFLFTIHHSFVAPAKAPADAPASAPVRRPGTGRAQARKKLEVYALRRKNRCEQPNSCEDALRSSVPIRINTK